MNDHEPLVRLPTQRPERHEREHGEGRCGQKAGAHPWVIDGLVVGESAYASVEVDGDEKDDSE